MLALNVSVDDEGIGGRILREKFVIIIINLIGIDDICICAVLIQIGDHTWNTNWYVRIMKLPLNFKKHILLP